MEIRIRETGNVVMEQEFRAMFPNTSMPQQLTTDLLNDFGADPVLEGPQAQPTKYQVAYRDGVQQIDGQWFTKYSVSDLTPEQCAEVDAANAKALQEGIVTATQKRLDDFAQTRAYDGILSACTYSTSPTAKFATEGQYCVEMRDATWAMLYQIMAEVEAGTRPMPTGYADIEPDLPALVWPV